MSAYFNYLGKLLTQFFKDFGAFFYHAANFRVRFFPVLWSVLNSQRETEGRQDILSQEGEMPAGTCYAREP